MFALLAQIAASGLARAAPQIGLSLLIGALIYSLIAMLRLASAPGNFRAVEGSALRCAPDPTHKSLGTGGTQFTSIGPTAGRRLSDRLSRSEASRGLAEL
jgi:hypothetical protein